jgi:hypothetical protein
MDGDMDLQFEYIRDLIFIGKLGSMKENLNRNFVIIITYNYCNLFY